ncbi:unnamed protein product [Oikopleura dioica]|uniref:Uncharacterized protein n=1 Tax=Oikopleura dioica TaxID=34765 RepID=E4X0J1_OIKDI|nr:unnamed protein product [Oikopleura dioica]
MRLMEILLRRRAVLNDELGLVKINKETNIADLSDSDCIESADASKLFQAKKGGQLPNLVKETLRKANKQTKKALTDTQLVELFNAESSSVAKKKSAKKITKRKPNRGKAPNNVRKTKKPAKL